MTLMRLGHNESSDLDVFWVHGDDARVPPAGPQNVSCCEDPGLRQQGPGAKPPILWDPRQIFHTEQNLPGEETRFCTTASHDPLNLRRERAGGPAAGWRGNNMNNLFTEAELSGLQPVQK